MSGSTTPPADGRALTGAGAGADKAFAGLLAVFLVAGLVQIFLAGFGVFDLLGGEGEDGSSFDPHRTLGFTMGIVALLLLLLALIARVDATTMLLAFGLAVMTAGLQSLLAELGEDTALIGGLHAVNGLALLGLASYLRVAAQRRQGTLPRR